MLAAAVIPAPIAYIKVAAVYSQYGVWRALYAPLAGSGAEVFVHSRGATHGLSWNLLEPSSWPPCRTPEIRLWLYDLYMPPRRRP